MSGIAYFCRNKRRCGAFIVKVRKPALILLLIVASALRAQNGGHRVYSFLDIPMTPRAAGLGGTSMPIRGNDINLLYSNPASLNPSMHQQAALNYCNFVGDINLLYAGYAHHFGSKGTGAVSLQGFNYGKFAGYDEYGQKTNEFRAADFSMNLSWARPFADSMFNIGVTLKTILSEYDVYSSIGNAVDLGISYRTKSDLNLSLLARNVGYMWKQYNTGAEQQRNLPNDVQLGLSKKVEKAPFRLMLVYDQLLKRNLSFVSPIDTTGKSSSLITETTQKDSTSFQKFSASFGKRADNFMRHMIIGTEIILGKSFTVRIGYNYRRQREMILTERRGMSAFSFGFTLAVKRFGFSYSFAKMAFPGNSSTFGLTFSW